MIYTPLLIKKERMKLNEIIQLQNIVEQKGKCEGLLCRNCPDSLSDLCLHYLLSDSIVFNKATELLEELNEQS